MGLRGRGANGIKGRELYQPEPQPWEEEGLSRFERVCRFLEELPITAGLLAGEKLKLLPFQKDFLRQVYRTDRRGRRPVRQGVLSTPRKQGKSSLSAGLCLCHLLGPEAEPRGQLYSAALDVAQASLILNEMVAIIEAVPWMRERVNIKRQVKEIHDLKNGSVYKALSAKAGNKMGLSASFVVYDELGSTPSRELFDALATSMGARKEPLMLVISTQAPYGSWPLSRLIDYGLKVKSGEIKDKTFAMTFLAAGEDDDPWSPATWRKCNPALGKFLSLEDFRSQAEMAKVMPSQQPAFFNLRLNLRCETTARWITQKLWKTCGDYVPDSETSGEWYCGLDMSTTTDISAFVAYNPASGAVRCWCWLPEVGLREKEMQDQCPYVEWKNSGDLLVTPGKTIDRRAIAKFVADFCRDHDVRAVAYDSWRYKELERVYADDFGIDAKADLHFCEWRQGFQTMRIGVDAMEKALIDGTIHHGMHPVLTMCVANSKIVMDPAGNRKIVKERGAGRVDAAVAMAMAVGVASINEKKTVTITAEDAKGMVMSF